MNFGNRTAERQKENRWAVILAGGDGTRLRSLTRAITGDDRPKQFVPVLGGQTLLDQTRQRVASAISPSQTLFVVTQAHEPHYRSLAACVGENRLLVQPRNRGTAPAIVYPLMRIAANAPDATVAFFPSDHYFSDDELFMSHVDSAFDVAHTHDTVTLLGIAPESPEVEYGWIEPQASILNRLPRAITRVKRFWEKPTLNIARNLMNSGCLWNSFVMVGRVEMFLRMVHRALPRLHNSFGSLAGLYGTSPERDAIRRLYETLNETNFSHQVLAARSSDLTVMRVEGVGWSDLGEPARVLTTLGRLGMAAQLNAASA